MILFFRSFLGSPCASLSKKKDYQKVKEYVSKQASAYTEHRFIIFILFFIVTLEYSVVLISRLANK